MSFELPEDFSDIGVLLIAGSVTAIAALDDVVFVTGNFQNVGPNFVGSVARYFNGVWIGLVGSGIKNGVQPGAIRSVSLIALNSLGSIGHHPNQGLESSQWCLVLGGQFTSVGNSPITNMAYLCDQTWNISYSFYHLGQNGSFPELPWYGFDFDVSMSSILSVSQDQ